MEINKFTFLNTIKKLLYVFICTTIVSTLNTMSSNITSLKALLITSIPFFVLISIIIFKIKDKKLDILQKLLCLFFSIVIIIGKSFSGFGTLFILKEYLLFSIISIYFLYFLFTKLFMFFFGFGINVMV